MSDKIRLGVIGAAGRGIIAKWAMDNPKLNVEVTAVCDIKDEAFAKCREWYGNGIFCTKDYQELLRKDVDAVLITSPDFLHAEHAMAALQAKKPIYLEKPMAITIEDCDKLMAASKEYDTPLFVGHNMRYMNIIRKMRELVQSGAIGEVKSVWCRHFISYGGDAYFRDWHSERKNTTGLLLQKGAHDLDVIHYLTGRYTKKVTAMGSLSVYDKLPRRRPEDPYGNGDWGANDHRYPPTKQSGFSPVIDVEDQNMVLMDLGDGVLGSYLQCHFTPDACRNYTVIGTEGRIENIGDGPDSPIFLWNRRRDTTFAAVGDQVFRGDVIAEGGHGGSDTLIMQDFLRLVRRETTETDATMESARMAVAVGCCATESLRNGGIPIEIPSLK